MNLSRVTSTVCHRACLELQVFIYLIFFLTGSIVRLKRNRKVLYRFEIRSLVTESRAKIHSPDSRRRSNLRRVSAHEREPRDRVDARIRTSTARISTTEPRIAKWKETLFIYICPRNRPRRNFHVSVNTSRIVPRKIINIKISRTREYRRVLRKLKLLILRPEKTPDLKISRFLLSNSKNSSDSESSRSPLIRNQS